MDSSSSVGSSNFGDLQDFLESFVQRLVIGDNGIHLAIVTFSTDVNIAVDLNDFTDVDDIIDQIEDLDYERDDSNLSGALLTMRTLVFGQGGDRAGVPDVAIVFLGSEPDINEANVATEAEAARAAGIKLIAVGIEDYNIATLEEVASFPSEILTLEDYDDLPTILSPLTTSVCDSFQETGQCTGYKYLQQTAVNPIE